MPKINRQKQKQLDAFALDSFKRLSSTMFREQYKVTGAESILIAQVEFEDRVEAGLTSIADAKDVLNSPSKFATILFNAEIIYRKKEEQKIHARLSVLEKQTHWLPATAISLGAGTVTGLVFAVASPFITTWLQPTADQLFKRQSSALPANIAPQVAPVDITNNFYLFEGGAIHHSSPEQQSQPNTSRAKITCKGETMDAYKASLLELLHKGDIVTLHMNGKKMSMCYRPDAKTPKQQGSLAAK